MFGTFIFDLALRPLRQGHKELVEARSNAAVTSEADTGVANTNGASLDELFTIAVLDLIKKCFFFSNQKIMVVDVM